jgi:hypothetical protein
MSATARLVVQMPPAEKQSLDARARRAGLTTSEFVRRRVAEDSLESELEEHREEIEALLTILEAHAPSILAKIDETIADVTALNASITALGTKPPL